MSRRHRPTSDTSDFDDFADRPGTLSDQLAAEAARLVVEDGMEYGPAKWKAARQLARHGGPQRPDLPSNEAVEAQVREWIALFHADTQPGELQALREVALHWMQRLAEFRPHLSGAAWRGTATRLSAVHIDLYADDSKATEIALLNQGIDHDVHTLEQAGQPPVDVLTVASYSAYLKDTVTVHLIVRDKDDLRGALKPDALGQTWRGDTRALMGLMGLVDTPAA